MTSLPVEATKLRKFGPHTRVIGTLLVLLGTAGVILPGLMSLVTEIWIAWVFLVSGTFWAYHTFKSNPDSFMDWLKPLLLIVIGGLMLYYPVPGIAAVGLMISVYLILDAFGSFALARELQPAKGWGWMAFNGIVSLLLAVLFLIGWPATSLALVGIYVGISLAFDGWALLMVGWALRKAS